MEIYWSAWRSPSEMVYLIRQATRVPFQIVRTGPNPSKPKTISDIPTSHIDLMQTALGMAGLEEKNCL